MATVISSDALASHNVNKYSFKVIALGNSGDGAKEVFKEKKDTHEEEEPENTAAEIDSSALSNSSKESLIESLMKKTDDMSSNFIKLQMKLESKEEEYKAEIEKAKEEAFAQGLEAGLAQASSDTSNSMQNSIEQFSSSIIKVEESAKEFESALEGIKSELISAALDISQEVVKVELSSNSNEVAKVLSSELLNELQGASKVTLKVNPKNHGALSEHIGSLEHVDIVSDSAINEGGVIVVSDAGNIDSQISKRFERVKRAALSE